MVLTKDELLAYSKNNEDMCRYINAKSLKFLSLKAINIINEKEMQHIPNLLIIILRANI